jgi:hypothetical protein
MTITTQEAPARDGSAETGAKSLRKAAAGDAESSTPDASDAQELTACILGNVDRIAVEFNAVRAAADLGNKWGVINRLRKAGEFWRAIAKDAKALAEIADEGPEPWPDIEEPDIEVRFSRPAWGLSGRSRPFRFRQGGLAAILSFAEYLEGRQ